MGLLPSLHCPLTSTRSPVYCVFSEIKYAPLPAWHLFLNHRKHRKAGNSQYPFQDGHHVCPRMPLLTWLLMVPIPGKRGRPPLSQGQGSGAQRGNDLACPHPAGVSFEQSEDSGRRVSADSQASHFHASSLMRKHTREAHLPCEVLCNEKCYSFFYFLWLKTGREKERARARSSTNTDIP